MVYYNALYNWVVFHPLYTVNSQSLFHCSLVNQPNFRQKNAKKKPRVNPKKRWVNPGFWSPSLPSSHARHRKQGTFRPKAMETMVPYVGCRSIFSVKKCGNKTHLFGEKKPWVILVGEKVVGSWFLMAYEIIPILKVGRISFLGGSSHLVSG